MHADIYRKTFKVRSNFVTGSCIWLQEPVQKEETKYCILNMASRDQKLKSTFL